MDCDHMSKISIHTPTKGVTGSINQESQSAAYFNPHSHKGSDDYSASATDIDTDFNPHSHKGSDGSSLWILPDVFLDFNPHSHKGSDKVTFMLLPFRVNFNPHSHKGSDFQSFSSFDFFLYFNPHSHKGSDLECWRLQGYTDISIHTPTKGVTMIPQALRHLC